MVNLNHSQCTAVTKKKITELPQLQMHYNSGGKHLQKHSRGLRTIQVFCYCDTLYSSRTRYNDYQRTKKTKKQWQETQHLVTKTNSRARP